MFRSWEEYDRVQLILGRHGKPRPKNHIFEFTGMMRCGECEGMITAETKVKRQKNGNVHTYVYYHCTKRINQNCTQGCIEVGELKKQISKKIDEIEIPPEFHSYGMKWFQRENAKEAGTQQVVLGSNQKAYNAVLEKISNLVDMRASKEIGLEEFTKKQAEYLAEKNELKKNLDRTDNRVDQWNQTSKEMLTFIEEAQKKFKNGTLQTKRSILSTLGSNLIIKDKIISIDTEKTLLPMKKVAIEVKAIKERLEPLDTLEKQEQFEKLCTESTVMSAQLEQVRTAIQALYPDYFAIVRTW